MGAQIIRFPVERARLPQQANHDWLERLLRSAQYACAAPCWWAMERGITACGPCPFNPGNSK